VGEADIPAGEGSDLLNVWMVYWDGEQNGGGGWITKGLRGEVIADGSSGHVIQDGGGGEVGGR
jgi:hypothetical protein